MLMHNYNNINIVSDDLKYQEICWFHTLEGIWHPVEVETSPLNITFNKDITPNYVCTLINEDSRKIILSNVDNPNIIIEMILINSKKLVFNAISKEGLGTSPKITFTK